MVRADYLAGATARELARKYRTSPSSVYRHASAGGWTKQKLGDAVARAHVVAADADLSMLAPPRPAQLAQAALASLSAALSSGRACDARALAGVAETMRKRAEEERAEERRARSASEAAHAAMALRREAELVEKFKYAAGLAWKMLHNPAGAPAIFVDCIATFRKQHFGEDDVLALERAVQSARESRRYFGLDEAQWEAALRDMPASARP